MANRRQKSVAMAGADMTDPVNYSEWQSGKVEPALDGVYEKRFTLMPGEWSKPFRGRFKTGRWLRFNVEGESVWAISNGHQWQWRGLI